MIINPFGHLGDSNVHYNLSPPLGHNDGRCESDLTQAICELATKMGGRFAAERGLGRSKVALADKLRGPVECDLMRRVKLAFDPEKRLSQGVVATG